MLLVVDVGNTQTHFGAVRDGEIVEHWRFATDRSSTSDQLGAALRSLLELRGLGFERRQRVGALLDGARARARMGRRWRAATSSTRCSSSARASRPAMPIRLDNPRELGADRLVNAVAAWARFKRACIVVDFGTAITYDVVSGDGEYLGGIIAPGIEISLEALALRAAKLPQVELGEPRALIGKTTVDAVRSGIVYGFAGQVDGIVGRLRDELGAEAPVIATGGLAHHLVPVVHGVDRRGRRPADAGGAAPDLGAQPLNARASFAARRRGDHEPRVLSIAMQTTLVGCPNSPTA